MAAILKIQNGGLNGIGANVDINFWIPHTHIVIFCQLGLKTPIYAPKIVFWGQSCSVCIFVHNF